MSLRMNAHDSRPSLAISRRARPGPAGTASAIGHQACTRLASTNHRPIARVAPLAAWPMRSDRPWRRFLHVPTVLRVAGYRFYFWSRENREPPHVHIEQAERYAKFWLSPVLLADARGFRSHELSELRRLVEEHATSFEEKWHEHLRSQGPSGPA